MTTATTKRPLRNKKVVIYETSRVVGLLENMAVSKEMTLSEVVRTIIRDALDKPAGPAEALICTLIGYFRERRETAPEFYAAAEVARDMNINPALAGNLIQAAFPVHPVKRKGYPSAEIHKHLGAEATKGRTE